MRVSKTLVYLLIFTVVSSAIAYKLVMASYESLAHPEYSAYLID